MANAACRALLTSQRWSDLMANDWSRRTFVRGTALSTVLGANSSWSWAQDKKIPIEDFFRLSDMSGLRLSPDGKSVVAMRVRNKRQNLAVLDVVTRKWTFITNFDDADVVSPRWISSQRIVFTMRDGARGAAEQVGPGLFAIDKDAGNFRELANRTLLGSGDDRMLPASSAVFAKGALSADDEVIVTIASGRGARVIRSAHLYRLDTRTGLRSLLTEGGPRNAVGWLLDTKDVPRVAVSVEDDSESTVHYRAGADRPWEVLFRNKLDSSQNVSPVALTTDGGLYVRTRVDSDFAGVYRFDLERKKLDAEPVVVLKGYDIEPSDEATNLTDPLLFDKKGNFVGVRYHAEREGVFWLEDGRRKLQESLEATFPGRQVVWQGDIERSDGKLLVAVASDTEPGYYLLYDQAKRQIDPIGARFPWLGSDRLSRMETYRYSARDGLSIPATLTIPKGSTGKNLPLIVLHYGGPWVRAIRWGYDPVVQFLASRGYAVFMPAPRASTGYGWKHFRSGWKQWGLAMQDDVTDGVRDLIKRGVADPKRVCIAGASYGGYLAMMGLAKEPDLFKCGINWVGVTDPELMYIEWTDFAATRAREVSLPAMLGSPKEDAAQFALTSPVKRAAEIKQPVLMAYGGSDVRVPIINGERMRDALRKHNSVVEWVVYGEEGHGFRRPENTLDFWGRVERFLSSHL
jgi:dipeptidyl aminopeptidase/acylaminoacyl peptidase